MFVLNPMQDRASSPWRTTSAADDRPLSREDARSEASSGHHSSGSLHKSSSASSTGSRNGDQAPRVHHIPIVVEGQPQQRPDAHQQQRTQPEPKFSSFDRPNGLNVDQTQFGSWPSTQRGSSPAPPRSPRSRSPMPTHTENRVPIVIAEVPVMKQEQPLSQSAPENGPHVTRIPVNMPPAEPKEPKVDPLQEIETIKQEVDKLAQQVSQFDGTHQDKQYRYLDEMLTREMIKLDNIATDGQPEVRAARKQVICAIEKAVVELDQRSKPRESGQPVQQDVQQPETNHQQNAGDNSMEVDKSEHEQQPQGKMNVNQPQPVNEVVPPPIVLGAETAV